MKRMGRRTFFRGATGAAIGVGTGPLLGACTTTPVTARTPAAAAPPSEKLLVGVMGLRRQGMNDAMAFVKSGEAEVVGICDPDERFFPNALHYFEKHQGRQPSMAVKDFRRLLDSKDIEALIVGTPDHWHAIPTVLACQVGKDVYVEKPASHNIVEGRAMLNAARKYKRVVQVGSQQRSGTHYKTAVDHVESGKLGKVSLVRAWVVHERPTIGNPPDSAPPDGVDYDIWLGPAPKKPFNENRFHYNWHWFWDYGTGEIGNWGAHDIDIARWAMNAGYPTAVSATGGKFFFDDMRETPDTMVVTYDYPEFSLVWEQRLWSSRRVEDKHAGTAFYGSKGALEVDRQGWQMHPDDVESDVLKSEPSDQHQTHINNFIECVKTRGRPNADIEDGHRTAVLCHLGNIALRVNRKLFFDGNTETFIGDPAANEYLGREHRAPWTLPQV